MTESLVIREERDGIAVLTLNRPGKRNALSRAMRDEVVGRLDELENDDAVQVAIFTGAGPAFCAGFDRDELASGDAAEIFADATTYHRRVYTFTKPLLAAVNGPALGGGCDLAAMCDLRIAASTAAFGQPQVRFGAAAAYELMQAVIGTGAAREMCLTGRRYDAAAALAIGLVGRVVEPGQLTAAAMEIAREIATLPEGMARATKQSFLAGQPPLFTS